MSGRKKQFAFTLGDEAKGELEVVSAILGKSQASVLTTAIHQLYVSIPRARRERALALQRELRQGIRS